MSAKIYEVTIGRKVWLSRDEYSNYVLLWDVKPTLDEEYNTWHHDTQCEMWVTCYAEFTRVIGLDIAPGECVGPVYIGVVQP